MFTHICLFTYIYTYIYIFVILCHMHPRILLVGWLVCWLVPWWSESRLQEEFDWFCDLLSDAAEGPAAGRGGPRGPRGIGH